MRIFLFAALLFLGACRQVDVQPDDNPATSDPLIRQARLEFTGCGETSQVGMLLCQPGQTSYAVTEFPGKLTMTSAGGPGCSLRRDIAATPPRTRIPMPSFDDPKAFCTVTVIYLPQFVPDPKYEIHSAVGDVTWYGDSRYNRVRSRRLRTSETLSVTFSNVTKLAFVSRNVTDPVIVESNRLSHRSQVRGIDLYQIRTWYADGSTKYWILPVNWFSTRAKDIPYQVKDGVLYFGKEVSVISLNGELINDSRVRLPQKFDGIIRAYTVRARTLVLRWQNGTLTSVQ